MLTSGNRTPQHTSMDTTSLKSEFDAFDTDGNGVISKDEFMAVRLFKMFGILSQFLKIPFFSFQMMGKLYSKG